MKVVLDRNDLMDLFFEKFGDDAEVTLNLEEVHEDSRSRESRTKEYLTKSILIKVRLNRHFNSSMFLEDYLEEEEIDHLQAGN